MHTNTEIIVLKTIKYSDSAIIVQTYSKHFGRMSFLVRGINQKKGKFKSAFFLPGMVLNVTISYRPSKMLQTFYDISVPCALNSCYTSQSKTAILTLLCEILQKSLLEEEANTSLFEFVKNSFYILEFNDEQFSNFHLIFILKLSKFLGFYPLREDKVRINYFDLLAGCFSNEVPKHKHYIENTNCMRLLEIMTVDYDSMHEVGLNRIQRNELVNILISYYQLHIPDMGKLQSPDILQELFD